MSEDRKPASATAPTVAIVESDGCIPDSVHVFPDDAAATEYLLERLASDKYGDRLNPEQLGEYWLDGSGDPAPIDNGYFVDGSGDCEIRVMAIANAEGSDAE